MEGLAVGRLITVEGVVPVGPGVRPACVVTRRRDSDERRQSAAIAPSLPPAQPLVAAAVMAVVEEQGHPRVMVVPVEMSGSGRGCGSERERALASARHLISGTQSPALTIYYNTIVLNSIAIPSGSGGLAGGHGIGGAGTTPGANGSDGIAGDAPINGHGGGISRSAGSVALSANETLADNLAGIELHELLYRLTWPMTPPAAGT